MPSAKGNGMRSRVLQHVTSAAVSALLLFCARRMECFGFDSSYAVSSGDMMVVVVALLLMYASIVV